MRIAFCVRLAESNGRKFAARGGGARRGSGAGTMRRGPERDRMSRAVEEWTVRELERQDKLCRSKSAGKLIAEVVS